MVPRDDLSHAITAEPPTVHASKPIPDNEQGQLDLRHSISIFHNVPLLWISLAYPVVNILVLFLGVGSMGLLEITNFYCFSFVLPILTVILIGLLRLANVLRCHWLVFDAFLAWMSLIGYLNMQLFFMAWASV